MTLLSKVDRLAIVAAFFWAIAVMASLSWNIYNKEQQILQLADEDARANLNRDMAFRKWSTGHGGIYLAVDENTWPSPYLSSIPERDVITQSGKVLTLQNPAASLREIKRTQDELYGSLARITGAKYLNPENKPDDWEIKALGIVGQTKTDYSELVWIDGKEYLRRMRPMWMEAKCLKCHAWTGIKPGELRGATDIAIPLGAYRESLKKADVAITTTHAAALLVGWLVIAWGYRYSLDMQGKAREFHRHIERLSHDDLTGAFNRHRFLEIANQETTRAIRYSRPMSVMMIDIDRFKEINDVFGHAVGDRALELASSTFRSIMRESDVVGRLGGDEFVILMPETAKPEAVEIAERLRAAIEEALVQPLSNGEKVSFTISLGIASLNEELASFEALLQKADEALYTAKRGGRNQVSYS